MERSTAYWTSRRTSQRFAGANLKSRDRGQHRPVFVVGAGRHDGDFASDHDAPAVAPRTIPTATLDVVEVYPYVPYIQYLLPGTIVLAIFVSAMTGGGIIFIDDKARVVGTRRYLVTPIRKFELILGFTFAGHHQGHHRGRRCAYQRSVP